MKQESKLKIDNKLKNKQRKIALNIINFLNKNITYEYGYPSKTTWGYAFTYLAALKLNQPENSEIIINSKNNLYKQDYNQKEYPWEFIVFALFESYQISKSYINHPAEELRRKGTRVLNWKLLNYLNKINFKLFNFIDNLSLKFLVNRYQRDDGLLQDQFKTRSLQYHNFSLLIILKIFEKNKDMYWLEKCIKKAMKLSTSLIFSDGTANFIGRGQEQIFGYGALLAAIKIYSEIYNEDLYPIEYKLTEKLKFFQKENGSLPLVLSSRNNKDSELNYFLNKPAGWYSYNSIFDYLPFLAYCLIL